MPVCSFSLLSLFVFEYSCIIFFHFFFFVFALARSALSIFMLFNDYFPSSKGPFIFYGVGGAGGIW